MPSRHRVVQLVLLLWLAGVVGQADVSAQTIAVPFDTASWDLSRGEVQEHLGRPALQGVATLKDVEFQNGVIEFDIAVREARAYPGIDFRIQSPGDYEQFYIRPHVNKFRSDALQYTPVFNGLAEWQLYNGPGFTATADIEHDRWIHIRLEVRDAQARVFFDTIPEPALVIQDLKHGVSRGGIRLAGQGGGTAFYSNFAYTLTDSLQFDTAPASYYPRGLITQWELSQTFRLRDMDITQHPADQDLAMAPWETVRTDASGLLDIARHRAARRTEATAVCARTIIQADSAHTHRYALGYSDLVLVFHNGRQAFIGNSAYRSRDPHFSGIMGRHDYLAIALEPGPNELLFVVGETFGGWGLMCQDYDDHYQDASLTRLWELRAGMSYPETALYDRRRNVLYITHYYHQRGNEFISRLSLDGQVLESEWVGGLNMPLGMCLLNDRLFVAERRSLAIIDVDSGRVLDHLAVPDAAFLNGVTADPAGNLYITDSDKNRIYSYRDGEFTTWLEGDDVQDPNGILFSSGAVIFGNSGDGCWKRVDLATQAIDTLARFESGSLLDGIRSDGRGGYLVSDFNGRVFRISADGERTELLNGTSSEQKYANLEYIPDKRLLVIPTLYSNQVLAFRY
jgi:sugar lactone lactonase YvrE